ncbi:helix-turn-helix transcriptional regulator [Acetanaerobacterium elongatum]|uniref:Predicted DNA-binding transcriptional regulator YafY, contains an HTH and WYL domains n=1 Tax=Acetanaerobacterium elongatum TaxID=258515 RepID=A0A1G9VRY4_9FIRM|nr:YafY family protein [Acetanaerobacterium elongatum]SDM74959.1 Predicted DNA-binding transcriptional regulator YafY, contains an HTH and WYL domains [Acetanaerobacterium elongatum]
MKIDRLLGILSILSKKPKVKAKDLAERFEVSIRTIYRDVEVICQAGIPLVTSPGGDGGISIAEGFTLGKDVLTRNDLESIILGLKSLESVTQGTQIRSLLTRLAPEPESSIIPAGSDVVIDLASFYRSSLAPKISLLREAIAVKQTVRFDYYAKNGHTLREIEPYLIAFKWSAWYVFGFCRLRQDFRLFKLNRITELTLTGEGFEPRSLTAEQADLDAFYQDPEKRHYATLLLSRDLEYIMIDEYGINSYKPVDEQSIVAQWDYINEREMVKTVLRLGSGAKVLAPKSLADAVKDEALKILQNYSE